MSGGDEREVEERGRVREGGWKVVFWNVAGLGNKDKEFWKGLAEWDVIILSETWTDEKGWEKIRGKLPKDFVWGVRKAVRKGKRGRAIGGLVMGIRKEVKEQEEGIISDREGMIEGKVKVGNEKWRIIGVYVNKNMEESLNNMEQWMEENREGYKMLIGGDFNARTGSEGGAVVKEELYSSGTRKGRMSKDKVKNKEGEKLVRLVEEKGWSIFNGNIAGDEEGEFTFTGGRGCTVIDYVIGDEEVRGKVRSMKVGDRIDSDHHPLELWIEGEREKTERGGRTAKARRVKWNEEGRERFEENLNLEVERMELEEEWIEVEKRVKEAMRETEEAQRKNERKSTGWWDEECREKKKEVRKELRKWRKNRADREEYKEKKREYKLICEQKKREENENWEREVDRVKKEGEVWEIVNRGRKRRKMINEEIEEREWREHFMRLLGGVEYRVVGGKKSGRKAEEEEIRMEEITEAMRRMKEGKAVGGDGIPGEAWRYGGEKTKKWL